MIVLLSIHPQHAHDIIEGRKLFEFRRVPPRAVSRLVLYATAPVRRIIGHAKVKAVLADSPEGLWPRCEHGAAISREQFFRYFAGRERAFAIQVETATPLRHPVETSLLGRFCVPQSFRYLDAELFRRLLLQGNLVAP